MHFITVLGLLSAAAALPTAPVAPRDALTVSGADVVSSTSHMERSDHASHIEARALYDMSFDWPETSFAHGNWSFQFKLDKLSNGKYTLTWWNTDNLHRKVKLILNSSSGSTIITITPDPNTTGSTTITPSGSSFRAILDFV
ncbi:hypothetical protein ACHAPO_008247 [Fusarium lateritium]